MYLSSRGITFLAHADYANHADSYITIARMCLRMKAYPWNP